MKNKSLLIPFVEVFSKVISFLNILLLIRILPIDDYADYSYIVAIVLWASVLMDGGINSLIYNKSLKQEITGINVLFTGRLFLSLIIIVLIAIFFIITTPTLATSAIIFSFLIYFSSSSVLIKMLSRGLGFVKVDFISIVCEPIIRLAFLLCIYFTKGYFDYSLWGVLLIYLMAGILAFTINKYYLSISFSLKIRFSSVKSVFTNIIIALNQSKYYLLYYLMLIGLGRIEVLFLENYSEKTQVAIFSSTFNIYRVAQLFFFSIITSQFIKLYNNKGIIIKVFIPLLLLTIFFTNVISPYIFEYLFPIEYINGQFVLNVLIIAILPSVINFYFITQNNYENKVRINFILLFIVFLIKVIIYFILKPSDVLTYSYGYLIAEILLLLFFIIYKFYENITNK